MAGKQAPKKEQTVVEEQPQVEVQEGGTKERDSEGQPLPEVEEFNRHVQNLVAHKAQEIFAELEQRIVDLEMLVGQPQGAVQFTGNHPGNQGEPKDPEPVEVYGGSDLGMNDGGVPWYSPDLGD